MADETPTPKFVIERIYLQDVSLETPQPADAANRQWKPRVDLDINTSNKGIESNRFDVTLRLTITVKDQES